MNRREALHILGLDDDASEADIKIAYREMAQILHPDRFAGNKKLEERATEQFKNLQEAYEFLILNKGGRAHPKTGQKYTQQTSSHHHSRSTAEDLEAQLAGIAAARVQLISQRDLVFDERRNAGAMIALGMIAACICGRRPVGLFGFITAIGVAIVVWGITQALTAQRTITTIDEHLDELAREKLKLQAMLNND